MGSDIANEDRVLLRKFVEQHSEILRKFDEAQKKAMGDYEESLQDGYQSQYCNGVLRGMRIIREFLCVLEHNRGLPDVGTWADQEPNEAALLRKAIEALREVREDLSADGEVSQQTESMVRAVLLAAC
jgi:hypothetical protein